jgi:CMP-N-acetylneuraminic acid synthetase
VVIYEIHQYERKHTITVDIIVILQPTTPLRTPSDIDHSVDMFLDTGAESLFSAYELTSMHPRNMFFLEGEFLTPVLTGGEYLRRRQDAKPVFMRNGALYLAKRSLVMDNHTLVGEKPRVYVMPRERSVNIDEPNDLILAEYQLKHQKSC